MFPGLDRVTGSTKIFYFDPIRNPLNIRLTPVKPINGGKFSVYMDLKDEKNKGLGYLEIYYEFKGKKIVKSALKLWSKRTGRHVCSDWSVLENSMAKLIRWELRTHHLARVNKRRNAHFRCGNANAFRNFLKSGVINSISIRITNHKSSFKLDSLLVFYGIERVPNVGSGSFMLLSQGKKAVQSSTGWGGHARFAVDGKTEGRYNHRYAIYCIYDNSLNS